MPSASRIWGLPPSRGKSAGPRGLTKSITTNAADVVGDITNTCSVVAGDRVNYKYACTGTCGGLGGIATAFKATFGGCDPSVPSNCKTFIGSTINFMAMAETTNYSSPYANNVNTTGELFPSEIKWRYSPHGLFPRMYMPT